MFRRNPRLLWALPAFLLSQCNFQPKLSPFETDGCSLAPEQLPRIEENWRDCCVEHDVAYWMGGTEEQRLAADERLRDCILAKTGKPRIADIFFRAVRRGGRAEFPTTYRWGYGWNYIRRPAPLSAEEVAMVEEMLTHPNSEIRPCGDCPVKVVSSGPPNR